MATSNAKESGGDRVGDEEMFESDSEEERRLLGTRRRKAASDEEEEERRETEGSSRAERFSPFESDESGGEGGAEDYDDEEEEEEEEGLEYEDEGLEREGEENEGFHVEERVREKDIEDSGERVEVEGDNVGVEVVGDGDGEGGEGKRENEPFAVPTAGAFYMHDDRFSDNLRGGGGGRRGRGRNRRTYGGRRLWESKDEKKWGHDKFEEMNMQDRHYEQGRSSSRGRYRGRGGRSRGREGGYAPRGQPRSFSNVNNQDQAPKVVRGRGPRKYEPMRNTSRAASISSKQPRKLLQKTLHGNKEKIFTPVPNAESNQVAPATRISILSSASPPFYPSGSANKDVTSTQKMDMQAASTSRNPRTPVVDESFSMQKGSGMMRGKDLADSVGMDRLYINDSVTTSTAKLLNSMQTLPSGSSSLALPSSQSRAQGRAVASSGQISYQTGLHNQFNRVSPAQRNVQSRIQASFQSSGQQSRPLSGSGSQTSSPPNTALSINSNEPRESEAISELRKSITAIDSKENSIVQGSGRGSYQYSGGQVVGASGNMGLGHGDQNFTAAPTFLPVMQFGGQHPRGIGVPAVGMAFPGYVAQSQLGLGNSEMTWLPVLTGAAGALGATFGSPYISVDGAYHARPSGQASVTSSSSGESNTNKSNNGWKPSERLELANDDFGQRQKPRRYSEMDFKQPSTST